MIGRMLTLQLDAEPDGYAVRVYCVMEPLAGQTFCGKGSTPLAAMRQAFAEAERQSWAELAWSRCLELLEESRAGGATP